MIALYYSRIKYSIVENGKREKTARYDFMRALADKLGVENVRYVIPDCYDQERDVFTSYFLLNSAGKLERHDEEFVPSFVIDRGFFGPKNRHSTIPVVSNHELRDVSLDKFTMYEVLRQYMPKSVGLLAGEEVSGTSNLGASFIVKARKGSGGKAVWVMDQATLTEWRTEHPEQDLLIQELVDSDGRPAGLGFDGRHDVRLFIAGDAVVGSYIRRPADGKYISNVNHGGKLKVVSPSTLPEELLQFATQVMSTLPSGARIFSIDCFYDAKAKAWKVIEINANAGLPSYSYGVHARECISGIADYVERIYNEMRKV
jgi:glutathione synthase/RimK-type ligase-like ATP-grasp enzyme